MDSLLIVMGGSAVAAVLFIIWMKYTKSGNRWVENL